MSFSKTKSSLSHTEENTPFLDAEDSTHTEITQWSLSRASTFALLQTAFFLFFCSILVLIVALTRSTWNPATDKQCYERFNVPSPAYDGVEYYETDFVNEFGQENEFMGRPTPELEARWTKLWLVGGISLPAADFPALNRSHEGYAEVGAGMYGAILEVHHHIHCLNLIRQYTWLNEFDALYFGLEDGPKLNRLHVDHCIETLRLALLCRADTTPLLIKSGDGNKPKPEFNSHHKCVRWDHFSDWVEDHVTWS